ncbi:MAG: NAD(P)-binding protein [Oscillatoria sp. SIO1A7]|nr:NAD(P)-binding protein [Oscillatoria sp. SIO1A7]
MTNGSENIDFAIVGGGVSGVYCAWRLKQKFPEKKIVVFEGSNHIGGRLLSVKPPGIDNMVAELGGMRILENTQYRIVALIKKLNKQLAANDKIELYDFPVDEPQNIAYLRGFHLRLSDFTAEPDKVPYNLSFLERSMSPGGIIVNAIEQIVPGITNEDLSEEQRREMAHKADFAGKKLYEQGFWNVLMRVITGEAYELSVDAGGYNSTLLNWNAADAIPWYLSDFGISPKYKGFKQGFQQVPNSVAMLFQEIGGEIRLRSKVDGFERVDGKFQLSVTPVGLNLLPYEVSADSLILAMPRRSLDLLAPKSPLLQLPEVERLTSSVTPRPLFKIFTTYTSPWWRAAGYTDAQGNFVPVESGRTVTDLPVRQTYYWPKDNGQPATEGPSMLMASYDDGTNVGFWDGLRPQRRQAWKKGLEVAEIANPFKGECSEEERKSNPWFQYYAGKPMVAEAARQLAVIHDLSYTPEVQHAAFRDWGDDPFGGGWNSWNIGVESPKVINEIIQPLADCPLYICGEAYSNSQGWVEGALETADLVLEKFDICPL